jgi:hypothetical protein
MNQNGNNGKSITGQPDALTVSFELLRQRALNAPFLSDKWTAEDVNVMYHGKIVDYNSSYILAVIVLVFVQDGKFKWFIQSQFVGKQSQKNISIGLLTPRNKLALEKISQLALESCGNKKTKRYYLKKDCRVWTFDLTDEELATLEPRLLDYVAKQTENKEDGSH